MSSPLRIDKPSGERWSAAKDFDFSSVAVSGSPRMSPKTREVLVSKLDKKNKAQRIFTYMITDQVPKIGLPVRQHRMDGGQIVRYIEAGTVVKIFMPEASASLPDGATHPTPPEWACLIHPVFHGWIKTAARANERAAEARWTCGVAQKPPDRLCGL